MSVRCAVVLLSVVLLLWPASALRHDSLALPIPARKKLCVHEDLLQSQRKILDVFVEKGGALDIDVQIYGPLTDEMLETGAYASPIYSDTVTGTNIKPELTQAYQHEFSAPYAGTYAFCLSNEHSRLFAKVVQVDLLDPVEKDAESEQTYVTDELKTSLYNLKKGLGRVQAQQKRDRHRLTLHSEANRASHNRLVFGSIIETIVFVCVSVFQIFFVRRWFQGRRNLKPWA